MTRPPDTYIPAPSRFQIASRLGAFRDTVTIPDPLGTTAKFTIYRAGSNAHKAWARARMDSDPNTLVMAEAALSTSDAAPLTADEKKKVDEVRADTSATTGILLSIIDRLSLNITQSSMQKEALRKLLSDGTIKPSEVLGRDNGESARNEALFFLKTWDDMPDIDGNQIPYDIETARELLMNDTPLEDSGDLHDVLIKVPAWTVDTGFGTEKDVPAGMVAEPVLDPKTGLPILNIVKWKEPTVLSNLTLGLAYQLLFTHTANDRALFRSKIIEAAAKNLPPSSGSISSPGDGQSGTAS